MYSKNISLSTEKEKTLHISFGVEDFFFRIFIFFILPLLGKNSHINRYILCKFQLHCLFGTISRMGHSSEIRESDGGIQRKFIRAYLVLFFFISISFYLYFVYNFYKQILELVWRSLCFLILENLNTKHGWY